MMILERHLLIAATEFLLVPGNSPKDRLPTFVMSKGRGHIPLHSGNSIFQIYSANDGLVAMSFTAKRRFISQLGARRDHVFRGAFSPQSTKNQRDKNSSKQTIPDELCDQYFHEVVLTVTANHIPSKENTNDARDKRGERDRSLVSHVGPHSDNSIEEAKKTREIAPRHTASQHIKDRNHDFAVINPRTLAVLRQQGGRATPIPRR
jgi:hypothetical protein